MAFGVFACARTPNDETEIAQSVVRIAGTACLKPILGTGAVVDNDWVVTSAHVIAGAGPDLRVITLDGAEIPVEVVGFDPEKDIALLLAVDLAAPSLRFSSAQSGTQGVIAAVTAGIELNLIEYRVNRKVLVKISNIYDEGEFDREALDIEASGVGPGVSGAPLLDEAGAMVGMFFAHSREREGGAYALDASEIEAFLEKIGERPVDRGRCRG